MDSDTLDDLDLQLLHALQIDGRAAYSTIAQVLGVSSRTVARRYGRLRTSGLVRVTGVAAPGPGRSLPPSGSSESRFEPVPPARWRAPSPSDRTPPG
ncbi:AsnC family protein [Nocardia sp. NPDC052278]|uniref:AsnC family protein n=1 Tax=unclassified Nocardia TaxID=2637762 RepID=UPI0036CA9829